jgi:hypothetical protein
VTALVDRGEARHARLDSGVQANNVNILRSAREIKETDRAIQPINQLEPRTPLKLPVLARYKIPHPGT